MSTNEQLVNTTVNTVNNEENKFKTPERPKRDLFEPPGAPIGKRRRLSKTAKELTEAINTLSLN
jgi:hypothetical protein